MSGTLVVAYLLREHFTDRAQVVSYLFLLLEVYLIEVFLKNRSKFAAFGIFLISVIIANIHAGAWYMLIILVLPFLGEYIFSLFAIDNVAKGTVKRNERKLQKLKETNSDKEKIKKIEDSINFDKEFLKSYKKRENTKVTITKNDNSKYLVIILFLIIIGGMITPNGTFTFTYLLKLMFGDTMNYINEHLPIVVASSVEFVVFIIFTITCIGFIDSKLSLSEAFLLLGLYFMTFIGRRHLILLTLLCSPILIRMMNDFIMKNIMKGENWEKRLELTEKFLFIFFAIIAVGVSIKEYTKNLKTDYILEDTYPVEASEWLNSYIEENDISKEDFHLYNEYNYGSYLLFKGIPVFIDSRAEPYSPEFNKDVTVFDDYMDLTSGKISYTELFEKYDINYAIVYQDSMTNTYMKEDENCLELYSDDYFVIYQILD